MVFGKTGRGLGEGSDPSWIEDRQRNTGRRQGARNDRFEAARRFHDDELWFEDEKAFNQAFKTCSVARNTKRVLGGKNMDVELVFRHVDADAAIILHCDPSLRMRARFVAQAPVRVQWN